MNAMNPIPAGNEGTRATAMAEAGTIKVRNRRFARNRKVDRWWLGGDPVATAWFNALSGTFPRGEAMFIDAVREHKEGASKELDGRIRAFIAQEVNHTREHLAFNRLAADAGYDMAMIDRRVEELLNLLKGRPKILDLASTIALEHFTAIMARELLDNPHHLDGGDPEITAMWRWHALEEIEHKAVAFDTWMHATRDWNRWKRWRIKSLMMLVVTQKFFANRIRDALDLLAQDGLTGWRTRVRLARFLLWSPGIMRRILPAWLTYFMPGFHPRNHDDSRLIVMQPDER